MAVVICRWRVCFATGNRTSLKNPSPCFTHVQLFRNLFSSEIVANQNTFLLLTRYIYIYFFIFDQTSFQFKCQDKCLLYTYNVGGRKVYKSSCSRGEVGNIGPKARLCGESSSKASFIPETLVLCLCIRCQKLIL